MSTLYFLSIFLYETSMQSQKLALLPLARLDMAWFGGCASYVSKGSFKKKTYGKAYFFNFQSDQSGWPSLIFFFSTYT